ncbi:hypothetical protein M501DRAFT_1023243 [Patellaria atrata CBS 101060]|uniref:Uncharacterized protein n=1 Tax=Patellaria atrata CBS 101060 TaxID=1346257 RepID=A0A9P4SED8_9PEZI|nr:hypothetical protein M501DRAFT_1023243 [Patellaria atrata CBS 101060]
MPYPVRAVLSTSAGFFCGVVLGMTQGGLMAGLRYRAENAHRLPKSQTGWFLYHKTKNYHVALGAVREGALMGIKVGIWTLLFFTIEEAVDRLREGLGEKDAVNTVCAGLGSAGAFSLWNKFPLPTAARTARIGLLAGIGFGFIQDVLYLARGNRLWYVDLVNYRPAHNPI